MAWTVYILSICSLLGGSLCVSDEAFRMLNQKVDLLQASLRIGFRDLETSYATDLQHVMIEVKELEAKLYKLEELIHTIGNVTERGVTNQTVDIKKDLTPEQKCREAIRGGKRMAKLLYEGVTVEKGKDWKWGSQDMGGIGKVIGLDIDNLALEWVRVKWNYGGTWNYRMGVKRAYDLMIVEKYFDFSRCHL